jgi:hypothetical protein
MKMASNGNKDPIANLTEKLRGLFGFGDHPKNNEHDAAQEAFQHLVFLFGRCFFFLSAAVIRFLQK